jgi:hypothetical protein
VAESKHSCQLNQPVHGAEELQHHLSKKKLSWGEPPQPLSLESIDPCTDAVGHQHHIFPHDIGHSRAGKKKGCAPFALYSRSQTSQPDPAASAAFPSKVGEKHCRAPRSRSLRAVAETKKKNKCREPPTRHHLFRGCFVLRTRGCVLERGRRVRLTERGSGHAG